MDEQNDGMLYLCIDSMKNVSNSKQGVANTPGPSLF